MSPKTDINIVSQTSIIGIYTHKRRKEDVSGPII